MESAANSEFFLHIPPVTGNPEKKSHNGLYRWFVGQGIALGATRVQKEEPQNGRKAIHSRLTPSFDEDNRDLVTGLPNFKAFEKHVSNLLQKDAINLCLNFGIIIISIGKQEELVEKLNKKGQSIVLNEIVYRISECLRETDYLARTHWNEFSLVVQKVDTDTEMLAVQSRIEKQLDYPLWINGRELELDYKVDGVIRNIK